MRVKRVYCSQKSNSNDSSEKYGYSFPYVRNLLSSIWPSEKEAEQKTIVGRPAVRQALPTRAVIVERSLAVVHRLVSAKTIHEQLQSAIHLERHLLRHPESLTLKQLRSVMPLLYSWRRKTHDFALKDQMARCLALMGHVRPVEASGIRLLSIDGGGARGLMALEVLQNLESYCFGYRIHELFDYIIGVSTGAVIGALLGGLRLNVKECKEIYEQVPLRLFDQSRIGGSLGLVLSHSYYNTDTWIRLLREAMGEKSFLDTTERRDHIKVGMVSCVSSGHELAPFIFRNYNHPFDKYSSFEGTCAFKLWEAAQASAAAPGYFQQCVLGDRVHQDGGMIVNNPTAVGIHECRLLWPSASFQCILSVGNGHYGPRLGDNISSESSLVDRIAKLVDTATETLTVHTTLSALMPASCYYRMNPYMSRPYTMDESNPERLKMMQDDANNYVRKNMPKLQAAACRLMRQKSSWQKLKECIPFKAGS
uniref:PNPLA domain-containing protein n=1 Tax=Trichuris muris TaxID=70415 RepID=A0A5S6Q821_TRIMR